MIFKTKFSGCLIAAVILTGCTYSQEAKSVKLYTSKLDQLIGKGEEEVIPVLTDQWGFIPQAQWAGADPSPETVLKKNHKRAPFSIKEAKEIFIEKGYYNVYVLAKMGSEGIATQGDFGDEGMVQGAHYRVHNYTNYVFVRIVFRDKQLCNFCFFPVQIGN